MTTKKIIFIVAAALFIIGAVLFGVYEFLPDTFTSAETIEAVADSTSVDTLVTDTVAVIADTIVK